MKKAASGLRFLLGKRKQRLRTNLRGFLPERRRTDKGNLFIMTDNWRTIDIDQYDEDAYTEDEILAEFESDISPQQAAADAQTRSTDVRNLLTK